MRQTRRATLSALASIIVAAVSAAHADAQVRVVNMIPRHLGNETFQNAEPTLAVNPRNPAKMAASAYAQGGDMCSRGVEAPIFTSSDTGKTWSLVCKIRVNSSSTLPPGDVSLRWADNGSALFAALLWPLSPLTLQVFQTPDPMSPEDFINVRSVDSVDQPDLEVATFRGRTRLYAAADFLGTTNNPGTAVVLVTGSDRSPQSDSALIPIERRRTFGSNYAVRVAAHPSGVVYALFYSPRPSKDGPFVVEDLVVVRDDSAALGKTPFAALRDLPVIKADSSCDGRDGLPGFRVARCRVVPYPAFGDVAGFGNQRRLSANLSIEVDPANPRAVWVAWADSADTNHYLLHVRRSLDAGRTWSNDLLTIPNATNPALAIAAAGNAGFLFQQLQKVGDTTRWVTRLFTSSDGFRTRRTYTMATTPADNPKPILQPYIGDYLELRAVGNTFFGVFSASNIPSNANFPNGVTYNRNADFSTHLLKNQHGGDTIGYSIDPFFFSVGPTENPACPALRAAKNSRANDIGCR